jgi:serpin B
MGRNDERIDRTLETLSTTTIGTEWIEPSELRRKAKTRRIRHRSIGIGMALAVVALAATLVPAGLRETPRPNAGFPIAKRLGSAVQLVSDSKGESLAPTDVSANTAARSEQQFSLSLLNQLSTTTPSSNILVSPSSLATALSMLELGARGDTQAQIASALGTESLTAEEQAAGWSALSAELEADAAPDNISLQSANSLWLQKGLEMNPTFMSSLSRYFASGVWQVDFASDPSQAVTDLNAWVNLETRGHITTLFGPGAITDQTALILANALYFKAQWEQPFASSTVDAQFQLPSGATTSIPFVHTSVNDPINASSFLGSDMDSVQLPYVGGHIAALILMPTSGSISEFAASLTQARFATVVSSMVPTELTLSMPALSMTSSNNLVSTLKALGISAAFDPNSADFSSATATPLVVSDATQKDTLSVTPWGSEATAATGIVGTAISGVESTTSINIDRPYLFLIRDLQTGEILFEAQVVNPAAN